MQTLVNGSILKRSGNIWGISGEKQMAKVLIVEDDEALSATIVEWLAYEHYNVESVNNGREALERLKCFEYDAVVLDWQLPELTGIEIIKQFRAGGGTTPILMLTGKQAISDKEVGFDAGADDYLTKPFHPKELAVRIRALMRRPGGFVGTTLKAGSLVLDSVNHRVEKEGREIQLQPMEFTLLEFFMRHPNQVFSTEALLHRVWDSETEASLDAIYTCIRRIRKKIDGASEPSIIKTVHGVGYKLEA